MKGRTVPEPDINLKTALSLYQKQLNNNKLYYQKITKHYQLS